MASNRSSGSACIACLATGVCLSLSGRVEQAIVATERLISSLNDVSVPFARYFQSIADTTNLRNRGRRYVRDLSPIGKPMVSMTLIILKE